MTNRDVASRMRNGTCICRCPDCGRRPCRRVCRRPVRFLAAAKNSAAAAYPMCCRCHLYRGHCRQRTPRTRRGRTGRPRIRGKLRMSSAVSGSLATCRPGYVKNVCANAGAVTSRVLLPCGRCTRTATVSHLMRCPAAGFGHGAAAPHPLLAAMLYLRRPVLLSAQHADSTSFPRHSMQMGPLPQAPSNMRHARSAESRGQNAAARRRKHNPGSLAVALPRLIPVKAPIRTRQ